MKNDWIKVAFAKENPDWNAKSGEGPEWIEGDIGFINVSQIVRVWPYDDKAKMSFVFCNSCGDAYKVWGSPEEIVNLILGVKPAPRESNMDRMFRNSRRARGVE